MEKNSGGDHRNNGRPTSAYNSFNNQKDWTNGRANLIKNLIVDLMRPNAGTKFNPALFRTVCNYLSKIVLTSQRTAPIPSPNDIGELAQGGLTRSSGSALGT